MSSEKIVHEINKTDLSKAKNSLEQLLYEKMAMAISEKKGKKKKKDDEDEYADETDKEDDGEGLDPVGAADSDVDNDGDSDESDAYLKNRRKVRKKEIGESVEIYYENYIKQKPDGTWCVYDDDDEVVKEFDSKSAAEDFLKEEVKQLDEFIPLVMMAAKAIGGRILKKVGGRALKAVGGMAKKALGGALGGGGDEPRRANEDTEVEKSSDSSRKLLYGMEKDRYMRLSDEEKDKVRTNYHQMKKEEGEEEGKKDKK